MRITRCKYGHYYDKAYFKECPHCYRARGGRDEDIIIENTKSSINMTGRNERINQIENEQSHKNQEERKRENIEREGQKKLDEKITKENLSTEKAIKEKSEKKKIQYKDIENFMLLSAMPLKVIKNQEFCIDVCFFPEKEWETGAKMLAFKSRESIRDLKPVRMWLPAKVTLHILYKDEEIFRKEIEIDVDRKSIFCTFPVTVTDTRDRRFHMIKVVFESKDQEVEIPLYLMPNP